MSALKTFLLNRFGAPAARPSEAAASFLWQQTPVPMRVGETIAAALRRGGVLDLGEAHGGLRARYFCGIGTCQACLVSIDGASPVEACLTPARSGCCITPVSRPPAAPPPTLGMAPPAESDAESAAETSAKTGAAKDVVTDAEPRVAERLEAR